MRFVALSKDNCPKCQWAKRQLMAYPIDWVNIKDDRGKALVEEFQVQFVPFFIVYDMDDVVVTTSSNVLAIRQMVFRKP